MKKNKIVNFIKDQHLYLHGKKKLLSVSKFLNLFGFEFERDYLAVRKAFSDNIDDFWKTYFGYGFNFDSKIPTKEELISIYERKLTVLGKCLGEEYQKVIDDWDNSALKGTEFHDNEEKISEEKGFILNPYDNKPYPLRKKPKLKKGIDNTSSVDFLSNLEDGSYTELLLFHIDKMVAGQSDEVFIETVNGIRYFDIGDHKTNNKKPKLDKNSSFCKYPIDNMYDCTYTKYNLQLSVYAYILSLFGYKPRNIGIYHYSNYDRNTKKVISMKYVHNEVDEMFSLYENFYKK